MTSRFKHPRGRDARPGKTAPNIDSTIVGQLHDGPAQSLTAGAMWLLLARRRATDPDVVHLLDKAQEAVAVGIRELRGIMDSPAPDVPSQETGA